MYSHCNSKEPSHPHSRNLWPQQMGCRMRCTGDQWRRACTGTGQTLGRRTARRNPPGSSHMGDRCRSPVGGSETPADTCAKAPSTAHFQHWINPCIRRRQAHVLAHIKAVAVARKYTVCLLHFEDNVMMRQKGASFRCVFLIDPSL